ncbi:hypothetical protein MED121_04233 [Marinomonas sp. MED121]|uniref:hypothetical protein n=1 Tax=Marinomonas sp. MED121 TaxID=314277 RepID=UPI000068FAA0|nr:hypothetical protein [Marinomonas sp. MED121]EAQ63950.1 hypothetical protein MED121_04233 [Marinomonas sp. MED121]
MTSAVENESLVIDTLWVQQVLSVKHGLAQLSAQLNKLPSVPEQVLLISAGEIKPLMNDSIRQFARDLVTRGCQLRFVSAACTSFHAAVFEASQSQNQDCLVIALELDQGLQQACLNSLGVGNEIAQDGLTVLNCVGLCLLRKKQAEINDTIIMQCDILSQPLGMSGTQKLLLQFERYIKRLPKNTQTVSFAINSLWGKKLELALKHRLTGPFAMSAWLASAEQGQQHFLSLKPLFELQGYQAALAKGPLLLLTLGGGGRLGCLLISRGQKALHALNQASLSEFSMQADQSAYQAALHTKEACQASYYQQVKHTLKYPKSQYRGINNHYFRWSQETLDLLTM